MSSHLRIFMALVFVLATIRVSAQIPNQTVRGTVVDKEAQIPLIGATVQIIGNEDVTGTTTDVDGRFSIPDVPVGRQTIEIQYIGYEPQVLQNIPLTAGKELVLNIELIEAIQQLEEVVVTAKTDKREAINEMATVSARSFSVEETERYAAAFQDPARMAQNFAGVTSSGDDLSNEIVIRGNSPSYVKWRLEGIEIPAPNHFSTKGSSGGGVSMLSSSMLANSDFYTGAFPAEIGNTLAGAFDLNFRNGNNQKRENSFQIGVIGLEASSEGPFKKGSDASYLVNYRYSALQLLDKVTDLDLGDSDPNYQDLSFKVNLPSQKAGVFSIFGIGGISKSEQKAIENPAQWTSYDDIFTTREENKYGLIGLSNRFLFKNQKTYLKTVLAGSMDQYTYFDEFFDVQNNMARVADEIEDLTDKVLRINTTLNHKANAKNSYRFGLTYSMLNYDFSYDNRNLTLLGNFEINYSPFITLIKDDANTSMIQFYGQWKHRPTEKITINTGVHFTRMALTESTAIEPRASIKWQFRPNQSIAVSAGLHSQAEHLINYTLQRPGANGPIQPNLDLQLTKAAHFVLGYDRNISSSTRLKVETYYQRLYDVPSDLAFDVGSIINAEDIYDVLFDGFAFTNDGVATNIGIDLTLERFLDKGFYYLVTGSVFDSKFEGIDGVEHNTRFNSNYNLTTLGGKEWVTGKSKQNSFAFNGKMVFNGGNRYSDYDFNTRTIRPGGIYRNQADAYFRMDLSFSYRKNRPNATHMFTLEIQNVTNRENVERLYPNFNAGRYDTGTQNGLIPNLYYRIEF